MRYVKISLSVGLALGLNRCLEVVGGTDSLLRVASLWHNCHASVRLVSACHTSALQSLGTNEWGRTYLFVILFQEENNPNVVFECNLMRFWKGGELWHVTSRSLQGFEDIFRQ